MQKRTHLSAGFTVAFYALVGDYCVRKQKESATMTTKTTVTTHRYNIPKPYAKPVLYTIKLFRSGIHFQNAVDISYQSFTSNKSDPDYISPNKLHRNTIMKHALKWIQNDCKF